MAIEATEIFEDKITDMNLKSRIESIEGKKIIRPKNLKLVKTRTESKELNKIKERAIIISSSGMATGGRILHHLANRIYEPSNTILFIGYQAEGTRGKTILEGAPKVRLHGQDFDIKAKIDSITGYSGHADYNETLAWLMGFNRPPERVFLTHGEPEASQALAEKIRSRFGWKVEIPAFGETVELDM
jgi:metallo-beta-lactamase family protein